MKVLVVLNFYYPHVSGLSEYARLASEGLAAMGHDVTVFTGRHDAALPDAETVGGVRVVRAKPLVFLHKGYLSSEFLTGYRRLAQAADVIHLHLPMLEAGALVSLTPTSLPLVATYHCDVAGQPHGNVVDHLAVRAVQASARRCLRRANRVLVSSLDYASSSPVLQGSKSKWVEFAPPDKAPRNLSPERGTAAPEKRIGFLGRFATEKGLEVLLDSIPLVVAEVPLARFLLAGENRHVRGGSTFEALGQRLEQLSGAVEIPGHIPEDELFAFYRSLDVLVLPSVNSYEAFGMVQVEAMKAGVTVIATDRPGVRRPVQMTGFGRLVPPCDPRALAAAIIAECRATDRPSRAEIAAAAWSAFSNERQFERLAELYQSEVHRRAA